jgi:hypothetical protein
VPKLRRQIVPDGYGAANKAVGLGVASAQICARRKMVTHLRRHRFDDVTQEGVLVWQGTLLREAKTLILPVEIDQHLDQLRQWFPQCSVEGRTKPWFEPPFHMQAEDQGVMQALQQHRRVPSQEIRPVIAPENGEREGPAGRNSRRRER